jgi:hypothetical protein
LNRPERPRRADQIIQRPQRPRPADLELAERALQEHDQEHEGDLTDLDPESRRRQEREKKVLHSGRSEITRHAVRWSRDRGVLAVLGYPDCAWRSNRSWDWSLICLCATLAGRRRAKLRHRAQIHRLQRTATLVLSLQANTPRPEGGKNRQPNGRQGSTPAKCFQPQHKKFRKHDRAPWFSCCRAPIALQ